MIVITNELANLPHHEGQRVLVAEREDLELQIIRFSAGYDVHAAVKQPSGGTYTILAALRSTVEEARNLACEVWPPRRCPVLFCSALLQMLPFDAIRGPAHSMQVVGS